MSTARFKKPTNPTSSHKSSTVNPAQLLSKEDILGGGDDPFTPLEIPELKKNGQAGIVHLRALPAGDMLAFAATPSESQNDALFTLIAKAVVNPDGTPIFNDSTDVDSLKSVSISVFNRLAQAILKMANASTGVATEGEASAGALSSGLSTDLPFA